MASNFTIESCYVTPHAQPCWYCAKAYGGCSWSARFEPVPGWVATERVLYHNGNGEKIRTMSYSIKFCPEFEEEASHET